MSGRGTWTKHVPSVEDILQDIWNASHMQDERFLFCLCVSIVYSVQCYCKTTLGKFMYQQVNTADVCKNCAEVGLNWMSSDAIFFFGGMLALEKACQSGQPGLVRDLSEGAGHCHVSHMVLTISCKPLSLHTALNSASVYTSTWIEGEAPPPVYK